MLSWVVCLWQRPATVPEVLPALGLVGSDGVCGLLPDGYHYSLDIGGKPEQASRLDEDLRGCPPSEGPRSHCSGTIVYLSLCGGQPLGELSGGNWIAYGPC